MCVLGHLRPVKDPLRTALAARLVPATSRLRVLHVGKALSDDMAVEARTEMAENPRYHWLGELPRWKALRVLARSHVLVLSSHMEGGANVLSEALAFGVPILASHIAGSIGLLGEDYPGYFPLAETAALARLLEQAERDPDFYQALSAWCARLAPLVHPAREFQAWASLLHEVAPGCGVGSRRCSWGQRRVASPSLVVTVSRETTARGEQCFGNRSSGNSPAWWPAPVEPLR